MSKTKSYIGIKNEAESSTLELHFTDFIYDGFDWETWEYINLVQSTIDKIKAANPTTIKIVINSLGGDVMIGLALYNYLKAHKATKKVEIIGFAASIASIMAMCASPGELKMAKSSFMIIHAAWTYASGNATDLRAEADNCEKVTNELASIYAERSGKDAKYFTELWADGDYWMTATEAKEMGLIDAFIDTEAVMASVKILNSFNFKNIPASLKNEAIQPQDQQTFFSNLNNQFMKIIDKLKAAISGAKEDPEIKKVENSASFLAALEKYFTPFAEAADQALEEKPEAEEEKVEAGASGEKKKEEKAEEEKLDEKKEDSKSDVDEELKAANARILKMEQEMEKMRNSLAGKFTKPDNESLNNESSGFSKAKVEYMED